MGGRRKGGIPPRKLLPVQSTHKAQSNQRTVDGGVIYASHARRRFQKGSLCLSDEVRHKLSSHMGYFVVAQTERKRHKG